MPDEQDRESLLGRLQEATSAEASLRQLRRRYEQLQDEYDALAARLSGLESAAGTAALPGTGSLSEALRDPLRRMLDEYLAARAETDAIIDGLRGIAGLPAPEVAAPGPTPPAEPPVSAPVERVGVRVGGGDVGALLDFQERLSALPGVARVSIETSEAGRSSLTVELG